MDCDYKECSRVVQCNHRTKAECCIIYKQVQKDIKQKNIQPKTTKEPNRQSNPLPVI